MKRKVDSIGPGWPRRDYLLSGAVAVGAALGARGGPRSDPPTDGAQLLFTA